MTDWDVAVVGAGIAGLTAAGVAAAHGLRAVAFEQLAPGGQLINLGEVSHYPGLPDTTTGPDLAGTLLETAMAAGVEIAYAEVTGLARGAPITLETVDGPQRARAVVVATGLSPGRLDVPGAEAYAGRGLSECASCDGPLFAGKDVVVVGDDEWAAQEALELAALAARVTLLVAGDAPAWSDGRAARLAAFPGVEIRTGATVTGLSSDGALGAVRLADGGEITAVGVFAYAGKAPRSAFLDGALRRRTDGRIDAGADLGTDAAGVFVAGDVRGGATPYLVAAAADGLRAGLAATSFVRS